MTKKAVQQIMLGTVTGNAKQAAQTLAAIKAAGYDGLELNGFMIKPTPFLVRMLTKAAGMPTGKGGSLDWVHMMKEAGLETISIHEDLGSIERDPEAIIKEAQLFSTNYVVITGMYRFDYTCEENMKKLCERLNAAGKKLKEGGVSLLYHNHNIEFQRIKNQDGKPGMTAYDYLIANTDPAYLNFELDSYWPTEAGVSALELMETLGNRMKLWHINDRGTRLTKMPITPILKSDSMELGYGNMNLETLTARAQELGVDAVVLESHKNWINQSPVDSLTLSAEFLKTHLR